MLPEEDLKVRQDTLIEELAKEPTSEIPPWTLYIDGSSTSLVSGIEIVLVSSEDATLEYALWFSFSTSNNKAKYEALITDLKLTKEMKVLALQIFNDSQLVMSQVNRKYEAWNASMIKYLVAPHTRTSQTLLCTGTNMPGNTAWSLGDMELTQDLKWC